MTPLNLPPAEPRRPGWLELIVGLLTYVVTMGVMLIWLVQIPETQAGLRGIVGNAANGIAGVAGLLAAFFLRIRDLRSFGFRPVSPKWLVMALGLAAMAFGLSFVIEHVYFSFIEEANTQADMQTAAKAGFLSLAILVFTGGLLTSFAEEFVSAASSPTR